MSTRLRITGLENATRRLKTQVGRAIQRAKFDKVIQDETVKQIRKDGLSPELAPSTIKYRKFYEANNQTHPDYETAKSNLTFTGSLLDSIRVRFRVVGLAFIFSAVGNHKRIRGKRGGLIGKPISNKELLGYANEDRPILQVYENNPEFKKSILQKLKDAIRQNFK